MWCSFDAVEMENALLISIIILVLALCLKNETKKEKRVVECCTDSTRNVVFLFCMRAQTESAVFSPQVLPAEGTKTNCH